MLTNTLAHVRLVLPAPTVKMLAILANQIRAKMAVNAQPTPSIKSSASARSATLVAIVRQQLILASQIHAKTEAFALPQIPIRFRVNVRLVSAATTVKLLPVSVN